MAERDYVSAPVSEKLGLEGVIMGLSDDLVALRERRISPQEAHASAAIAKQVFNGVRLYLQATQMIEARAKLVSAATEGESLALPADKAGGEDVGGGAAPGRGSLALPAKPKGAGDVGATGGSGGESPRLPAKP